MPSFRAKCTTICLWGAKPTWTMENKSIAWSVAIGWDWSRGIGCSGKKSGPRMSPRRSREKRDFWNNSRTAETYVARDRFRRIRPPEVTGEISRRSSRIPSCSNGAGRLRFGCSSKGLPPLPRVDRPSFCRPYKHCIREPRLSSAARIAALVADHATRGRGTHLASPGQCETGQSARQGFFRARCNLGSVY